MASSLKDTLLHFLNKKEANAPFLLALSGGPDSLALFHLLVEIQDFRKISWGVAHVDHSWRSESKQEAEQLSELAGKHKVPFYLKTLDPKLIKGNLEEGCRQERLRFFEFLCRDYGYQAVMLGHHADDQSETVLKRIFEGSMLTNLTAMQEVSRLNALTLWRPFLKVPKKHILQWIEQQGIRPFIDSTNLDSKFLRGRLRTQVIPTLTHQFGKEISANLCYLAEEACELQSYLALRLKRYEDKIEKGPFGILLDLSQECPETAFEMRFLVREVCSRRAVTLSRSAMNMAADLLLTGKGNRCIPLGEYTLHIDRRRLFLQKAICAVFPTEIQKLSLGISYYADWEIHVEKLSEAPKSLHGGWRSVWNGHVEAVLPLGDYSLGPPSMAALYPGHGCLGKLWTNDKVPAFLRKAIPVIWQEGQLKHEFLTHRKVCNSISADQWLYVSLRKRR